MADSFPLLATENRLNGGGQWALSVCIPCLRKQPLLLASRRWGRFARTNGTKRPQRRGARRRDCFPRLVYDVRTRRAHGKFGRRKTQANKLNLKQKLLKLRRWLCVSSCLACIAFAVRPTQRIPAARTRYLYSINCITNTSLRGSRCRSGSKINTDRFPKAFRAAGLRHAPPSGQFFR